MPLSTFAIWAVVQSSPLDDFIVDVKDGFRSARALDDWGMR